MTSFKIKKKEKMKGEKNGGYVEERSDLTLISISK
jgi:hypothetical protein